MADSSEQYRTALHRETQRKQYRAYEQHDLDRYHMTPEYAELKRSLPYRQWQRERNILSNQFSGAERTYLYQRGATGLASRPERV